MGKCGSAGLIVTAIAAFGIAGAVNAACSEDTVSIRDDAGSVQFTVAVADSIAERSRGLMFVEEMATTQGMLFVYRRPQSVSFWMKNTRIPLDIMYFDKDLKMVSISADTPPCRVARCQSYPSTGPAMYVLELNAGMASELGVAVGDRLILDLD